MVKGHEPFITRLQAKLNSYKLGGAYRFSLASPSAICLFSVMAFYTYLLLGCSSLISNNDSVNVPTQTSENLSDTEKDLSISHSATLDTYDASDLPQNIITVLPWPEETMTLAEYNSLTANTRVGMSTPSICLLIGPTLEPNDFSASPEEWFDQKTDLVVNGTLITEYYYLDTMDTLGSNIYVDESDGESKLVALVPPGSPFFICYEVPLDVGKHTVKFSYENSSGQVVDYWGEPTTFTWEFEIIDSDK